MVRSITYFVSKEKAFAINGSFWKDERLKNRFAHIKSPLHGGLCYQFLYIQLQLYLCLCLLLELLQLNRIHLRQLA